MKDLPQSIKGFYPLCEETKDKRYELKYNNRRYTIIAFIYQEDLYLNRRGNILGVNIIATLNDKKSAYKINVNLFYIMNDTAGDLIIEKNPPITFKIK